MEPFPSPDQLDPNLRSFLEEACNRLCDWFASTNNYGPLPVKQYVTPQIAPQLKGLSTEQLLNDLQLIMDSAYRPSHPGSLAHLDPPPLTASIVGDLICAGLNNNLLAEELSPSLTKIESELCKWFASKIGLPSGSGGVAASGGSLGNLMALVVARNKAQLQNDPNAAFLLSADAHVSFSKAIRVMGLPTDSLKKVSTNEEGKILINELSNSLNKMRSKGKKCFAVVATAGTTVRGAVDPLEEIADFCLKENLWLHIDGAIGGVFGLSEKTSSAVKGLSRADSLVVNPQKLFGIAKTSSLLLMANRLDLLSAFSTGLPYIEPPTGDEMHGGEIGIQGSRAAEVLKLWLGIRQLGEDGIEMLLDSSILRRVYLQKIIDSSIFKIISGPLHMLALTPKGFDTKSASDWSISTKKRLIKENFMLSRPFYEDNYFLKVVLGNPNTQRKHLDKLSVLLNNSVKKIKV